MKSCRDVESLVTPYLDGQIDPGERGDVEDHLEHCPPCRERAHQARTARAIVRTRGTALAPRAPAGLRTRCAALVPGAPRAASRSPRPFAALPRIGWLPISAAAVVLFGVTGLLVFSLSSRLDTALAAQLTIDHAKCFVLRPSKPPTVTPAQIAARYKAQQGWTVTVPPSDAAEGLQLIGGRRCLYGEGLMAHVMYDWHGKPLSIFVLPGARQTARLFEIMGHETIVWPEDGSTYALVGTAPRADMERMAARVRQMVRRVSEARAH
jgi:anti-sigma factor RsiW